MLQTRLLGRSVFRAYFDCACKLFDCFFNDAFYGCAAGVAVVVRVLTVVVRAGLMGPAPMVVCMLSGFFDALLIWVSAPGVCGKELLPFRSWQHCCFPSMVHGVMSIHSCAPTFVARHAVVRASLRSCLRRTKGQPPMHVAIYVCYDYYCQLSVHALGCAVAKATIHKAGILF